MTQMHSTQIRQPWTLLHDREDSTQHIDRSREVERAAAATKIEATLARNRDKAFADFTLCSRPYF